MHVHDVPHAKHVESCRFDKMVKCGREDIKDFEDVSGVLSSAYLVHGSASKVNCSGPDLQVVSSCHCYPVISYVEELTVFHISGLIL